MQLIYLSPVAWVSFAQRPHKLVEWFHKRTAGRVLWIEPYPTRLPMWKDFRRLETAPTTTAAALPWLQAIRPSSVPLEPLPVLRGINRLLWRQTRASAMQFAAQAPTMVVVGKPSAFALDLMEHLPGVTSLYDGMDDFPAFYSGLSRIAMSYHERQLAQRATHMSVSSTYLQQRWSDTRSDIRLVFNGLDAAALPEPKLHASARSQTIFGYVGTIGAWFDWDWVIALAHTRPNDLIKLIGPLFEPARRTLPPNIELHPQRMHAAALEAMREFDVGLIPFRRTPLTRSVDPIKYYEYRALGLPVISTRFGEMALRDAQDGVFVVDAHDELAMNVDASLQYRPDAEVIASFRQRHGWDAHFAELESLLDLSQTR